MSMNKSIRLIWILAGSIVVFTIIVLIVFYIIGFNYLPKYFPGIPVFFLLLTIILAFYVKNKLKADKELNVGSILGIRGLLMISVLTVMFINMLIDKEHVVSLAIAFIIYEIVFSIFETKILLTLNKKNS